MNKITTLIIACLAIAPARVHAIAPELAMRAFGASFGASAGDEHYEPYLDYNQDGIIGIPDFNAMRTRILSGLTIIDPPEDGIYQTPGMVVQYRYEPHAIVIETEDGERTEVAPLPGAAVGCIPGGDVSHAIYTVGHYRSIIDPYHWMETRGYPLSNLQIPGDEELIKQADELFLVECAPDHILHGYWRQIALMHGFLFPEMPLYARYKILLVITHMGVEVIQDTGFIDVPYVRDGEVIQINNLGADLLIDPVIFDPAEEGFFNQLLFPIQLDPEIQDIDDLIHMRRIDCSTIGGEEFCSITTTDPFVEVGLTEVFVKLKWDGEQFTSISVNNGLASIGTNVTTGHELTFMRTIFEVWTTGFGGGAVLQAGGGCEGGVTVNFDRQAYFLRFKCGSGGAVGYRGILSLGGGMQGDYRLELCNWRSGQLLCIWDALYRQLFPPTDAPPSDGEEPS